MYAKKTGDSLSRKGHCEVVVFVIEIRGVGSPPDIDFRGRAVEAGVGHCFLF